MLNINEYLEEHTQCKHIPVPTTKIFCTQEYNIDKITSSVVQRAKQLCPSIPARIQEAEDLALKYNQLLKLFAQCHFAYSTSQWLDDKQIHQLGKYFVIFIGV